MRVYALIRPCCVLSVLLAAAAAAPTDDATALHTNVGAIPTDADEAVHPAALAGHSFLVPHRLMAKAMYNGERERLRRAMHRMTQGEPSIISLIGGSVTAGMGAGDVKKGEPGSWAARLAVWAHKAFPRGNVQVANGGQPGVQSMYFAVCAKAHIPLDTDLVFVELAINDARSQDMGIDGEHRRSFERLIRKLLVLPHRPAVVLLNCYSWFQWEPFGTYYHNAESMNFEFATYYGLPMISVKAAVHHLMTAGVKGFSVAKRRYEVNASYPNELYFSDNMHPAGHTGHRAIADLAIFALATAMHGLAVRPFQDRELQFINAAVPMSMLADNFELSNDTCFLGAALQGAMVHTKGFEWVNEAPRGVLPKWGFTGSTAASSIQFQVSTQVVASAALGPTSQPARVTLHIAFLRSYEHMGRASVQCGPGCSCLPSEVDCHSGVHNSQLFLHTFAATQSPACLVTISILDNTTSGEHKVKIGGVMVSETDFNAPELGNGINIHEGAFVINVVE